MKDLRSLCVVWPLLLVAACMTGGDVIEGRGWKLVDVSGAPPVDPAGIVGVGFGSDGRFTVDTGCNSGGGTYHLDGNRIALDAETLQPSACSEVMSRQDGTIRSVVEGRPTYAIDTGTGHLRLTGDDGTVLLFDTP